MVCLIVGEKKRKVDARVATRVWGNKRAEGSLGGRQGSFDGGFMRWLDLEVRYSQRTKNSTKWGGSPRHNDIQTLVPLWMKEIVGTI